MSNNELSNEAAVKALSLVAEKWAKNQGVEVLNYYQTARDQASYDKIPSWARGQPVATDDSGDFARKMLEAIRDGTDPKAKVWAVQATAEVSSAEAQVLDPVSIALIGAIIIGGILAARVKKVGDITFYEGLPEGVPEILKTVAGLAAPSGSN